MPTLDSLFEALKLDHLAAQCDALLEQAAKKDLGYRELLTQALTCEWQGRKQKGAEARLAQARLPWLKTLEQFDFSFQPSIDRKVVRELSTLGFVERAENVVLLGPPGVGKTHLAIGLAIKAAQVGHRVLFLTLEQLMSKLKRASQENRLERQLQQLTYPKVLVLDETATCRCRGRTPACCSVWWRGVLEGLGVLTSQELSWTGVTSSAMRYWRRRSWTVCYTTRQRSTSRASYRLKTKRKAGMLSVAVKEEDGKAASG